MIEVQVIECSPADQWYNYADAFNLIVDSIQLAVLSNTVSIVAAIHIMPS